MQQGRCVAIGSGVQDVCDIPSLGRRVVQFRSGRVAVVIKSACNKDLTVRQQCRRVLGAFVIEAAGVRPGAACRIVQFGAGQRKPVLSPPATSTLPFGSNVAV